MRSPPPLRYRSATIQVRLKADAADPPTVCRNTLAAAVAASVPGPSWATILSPTARVESDVRAVSGDGVEVVLARADVQALGDGLRGNLVLPGHSAYDPARRVLNRQMDNVRR